MLSHFSHVQFFAILWTVAPQAPLSMRFSRQEYWGGLLCPPPGDLPNPGIKPASVMSPALEGGYFTTSEKGTQTAPLRIQCPCLQRERSFSWACGLDHCMCMARIHPTWRIVCWQGWRALPVHPAHYVWISTRPVMSLHKSQWPPTAREWSGVLSDGGRELPRACFMVSVKTPVLSLPSSLAKLGFLCVCLHVLSCVQLWDPMDCV